MVWGADPVYPDPPAPFVYEAISCEEAQVRMVKLSPQCVRRSRELGRGEYIVEHLSPNLAWVFVGSRYDDSGCFHYAQVSGVS